MFPADAAAPPQEPGPGSPPTDSPGQAPGADDGAATPPNGWQPAPGGPPAPPAVSLPKGGGAVKDIGEKFSVSAATGTAGLTIPLVTSPGRAGSGPSLSLRYDSGFGNGAFGYGWKLELPAVTRKTDKGLPRYLDDPDVDTFILAGAEDLVPIRAERDGGWREVATRRGEDGRDCRQSSEARCRRRARPATRPRRAAAGPFESRGRSSRSRCSSELSGIVTNRDRGG